MDEDCLSLNVWTPSVVGARCPTMVWIHGGGFRNGNGSAALYDGASFARDGIVLVTLNYRLHGFGFLYLDELFGAEGTGNLGILDQVAALEWVRDNIAAFGGDPDNVTVFGQSAGAMSVGTLLAVPRASGLFHRAIAQSGAGHHNLSTAGASRVAARVLELVEVEPGDWAALRDVPATRILDASIEVGQTEAARLLEGEFSAAMGFQPVIDGTTLPDRPVDRVAGGSAAGVDLVVGTCADELRLVTWGMPDGMRRDPDPVVPARLAGAGRSVEDAVGCYRAARAGRTRLDALSAMETDYRYTIPAARLAEAQAAHHANVRLYRFSWPTPVLDGALGACHGSELPFLFEVLGDVPYFVGDDPPAALADALHGAWVRFAATGDPGGGAIGAWPTYHPGRRSVLDFDTETRVVDDPDRAQRLLWVGLV